VKGGSEREDLERNRRPNRPVRDYLALLPAYDSARWGGMIPADALGGEVKGDFERELRVRVVMCGVSRHIHNPPVNSDGNIDEGEGKNRVGELLGWWPAGRIFRGTT
jgi:hypothetical protein